MIIEVKYHLINVLYSVSVLSARMYNMYVCMHEHMYNYFTFNIDVAENAFEVKLEQCPS